ncbi:MAG: hypothetical protein NC312_10625 [Bacteroides fragilis]|nr:hypothetical protein [Bacteroides fragilis]
MTIQTRLILNFHDFVIVHIKFYHIAFLYIFRKSSTSNIYKTAIIKLTVYYHAINS